MANYSKFLRSVGKYPLVVIVSIVLGIFAYDFTHHQLEAMIEKSLVEIAKQGAMAVENDINRQLENLATISLMDEVSDDEVPMETKLKIIAAVSPRKDIIEYAIADRYSALYCSSGKKYDVSYETFYKSALHGKSNVAISKQRFSGISSVVYAVPIFNGNKITGVLCAIYSNETLSSLVENISYGKSGYGYIIDGTGATIAHKDRELAKKGNNFVTEYQPDVEGEELKNLGKRMIAGETGYGWYKYKGQKKYMGFAKINGVSWSFGATAPSSDAFENANPMLTFIVLCIIIFGLALVIVNFYFRSMNKKIKHEEKALKNAVEAANIIRISFLEDGTILDFNLYAEERLGYEGEQVIKTLSIYNLVDDKDKTRLSGILGGLDKDSRKENFELGMRTMQGETEHVLFNLSVIDHEDATLVYELMGIDISDRVKQEKELILKHEELTAVYEELAASEEELKDQFDELMRQKMMLQEKDDRHNLVVEASNIGMWDYDAVTNRHFYSDKWYEIFEASKDEFMGKEKEWMDFILPEDIKVASMAYNRHLERMTPYYECEYRIQTREGNIKWVYSVGKALWDADGNLVKMAGAFTDISSRKAIEEKVSRLAYFDSLTGLSNRSQITEKFNLLTGTGEESIALIFIDLENYKLINDSYGHAIGDRMLIEISNRLNKVCTPNMKISRLGGDEYAILVHDYGSTEALNVFAEDLSHRVESLSRIGGYNISVSINIGIALYPENASGFDELLKNAEMAASRAAEKKCKQLFYSKEMSDAIVERLNLRNSLKAAIENKEFVLYYQPQFQTKDRRIVGFEALVRWRSKTMGMIPPNKFIPIAEESKLIIPLGEWILEESVRFIKKMHDNGHDKLFMSVNISVIELIQQNFAEKVLGIIKAYGLTPGSLELEITESVMMESVDSVLDNIAVLRNAGVKIALDDFGTGYSSLNYLTQLPINTLKIDKSFIDDIGQVREKVLLLSTIVEIGQKLGLSIVAEGVETEDQFDYLAQRNCERIQGFLLSKPLPEEEIVRLVGQ